MTFMCSKCSPEVAIARQRKNIEVFAVGVGVLRCPLLL